MGKAEPFPPPSQEQGGWGAALGIGHLHMDGDRLRVGRQGKAMAAGNWCPAASLVKRLMVLWAETGSWP